MSSKKSYWITTPLLLVATFGIFFTFGTPYIGDGIHNRTHGWGGHIGIERYNWDADPHKEAFLVFDDDPPGGTPEPTPQPTPPQEPAQPVSTGRQE